ncbi:MAG: hypothetical protein ACR2K1_10350, partial [Saprospiraceae bacterium]
LYRVLPDKFELFILRAKILNNLVSAIVDRRTARPFFCGILGGCSKDCFLCRMKHPLGIFSLGQKQRLFCCDRHIKSFRV